MCIFVPRYEEHNYRLFVPIAMDFYLGDAVFR